MKLFIISLSAMVVGCKPTPQTQSDLSSLENLTANNGTELVQNRCEGPYLNVQYADLESADVPPEFREDFNKALTSIPLGLRELFSTSMLGKYVVSKNIAEDCKGAFSNINESRLKSNLDTTACLRGQPGEPGIELVIPANKDSIRHALVRGFFAVAFTAMAETRNVPKLKFFVAGDKDPELANIERSLVIALRSDMEASATGDRARLVELFGAEIAQLRDPNQFGPAFDRLPAQQKASISLSVVRETADQYYCSKQTRSAMFAKFNATYNAFKTLWVRPVHQLLEERDPEELVGAASMYQNPSTVSQGNAAALVSSKSDANEGLALFGRAGPGLFPAWRQARLSARESGGVGLFPQWNVARQVGYAEGGRGLFPNWDNARQAAYSEGGVGAFPVWSLSRQNARQELRQAGYPGTSLFPRYWANRLYS